MNHLKERRLILAKASQFGGSVSQLQNRDRTATRQVTQQAENNRTVQQTQRQIVTNMNEQARQSGSNTTFSRGSVTPSRVLSDAEADAKGVPRGTKIAIDGTPGQRGTQINGVEVDPVTGQPVEGSAFSIPGSAMYQQSGQPRVSIEQENAGNSPQEGRIAQLRKLRQAGFEGGIGPDGKVVNKGINLDVNGNPMGAATPEQIAQNQKDLQGSMNVNFGVTHEERAKARRIEMQIAAMDPSKLIKGETNNGLPYESPAEFEARKAAVMQQQQLLRQQLTEIYQKAQNANQPGAIPGDPNAPQQPGMPQDPNNPNANLPSPDIQAPTYDPMDPAAQQLGQSAGRAGEVYEGLLGEAGAPDHQQFEDDKAMARKDLNDRLDFQDEMTDLQKERAEENKRKSLAENDRAAAYQQILDNESFLKQMKQNEENEVLARRRINKLSGGHDFSGVKFVAKQVQDGLDAMTFMKQKAANMQGRYADTAIGIINHYGMEMKQADIDKKQGYNTSYDSYKTELRDIKKDFNLDAQERRKLRSEAHKWYSDELTKLDMKHGDNLNTLRLKAIDRVNMLDKERSTNERAQISNAIKMLALATKKGVKMTPEAMASFEKQIAPDLAPGWMAFSLPSAGGAGGGGVNSKVWTPEGLQAAQQWISETPGRSFTQLSPSDQQWLVPVFEQARPEGTIPPGVHGPQPAGYNPNPFSFEKKEPGSMPSYIEEYDEIKRRTGKPPVDGTGQAMSMQQYIGSRSFNFQLSGNAGGIPQQQPAQQTTIIQEAPDTTEDAIIFSEDSDSYDFE